MNERKKKCFFCKIETKHRIIFKVFGGANLKINEEYLCICRKGRTKFHKVTKPVVNYLEISIIKKLSNNESNNEQEGEKDGCKDKGTNRRNVIRLESNKSKNTMKMKQEAKC